MAAFPPFLKKDCVYHLKGLWEVLALQENHGPEREREREVKYIYVYGTDWNKQISVKWQVVRSKNNQIQLKILQAFRI